MVVGSRLQGTQLESDVMCTEPDTMLLYVTLMITCQYCIRSNANVS